MTCVEEHEEKPINDWFNETTHIERMKNTDYVTMSLREVTLIILASGRKVERFSQHLDKIVFILLSCHCTIPVQAQALLLSNPCSRCMSMRKSQTDAKALRRVDSSIAQDGTETKLC